MAGKKRPRRPSLYDDSEPHHHLYLVDQILKKRDDLYEVLRLEYVAPKIAPKGKEFQRLVQIVWEAAGANLKWQFLEDSLRHLAGTVPTPELYRNTCWRIMGNIPRLKGKHAVPPWTTQRFREWVPVMLLSCRRELRGNKKGVVLGGVVQAGTPCSRWISRWLSLPVCRILAFGTGFLRQRWGASRYPFLSPEQLVGLRICVVVEPDLCGREPGCSVPLERSERTRLIRPHPLVFPPAIREWNRERLKRKFRVDPGYHCPKDYPVTFRCQQCPVGLVHCSAATHLHDWEERHCDECNRDDALFDPDLASDVCVDCYNRAAWRRGQR